MIPAGLFLFGIFFAVWVYFDKALSFYQEHLRIDSFRSGHREILYSEMEITQLILQHAVYGNPRNVFKVCKVGEEFNNSPLIVIDTKISNLNTTLHEWLKPPKTKSLDDFKARYGN